MRNYMLGIGGLLLDFEDGKFFQNVERVLNEWFEIPSISFLYSALSGMGIEDDYYFVQKEEADDYHVRMLISSEKGKNKYTVMFNNLHHQVFYLKSNDECEWKTFSFEFRVVMKPIDLNLIL